MLSKEQAKIEGIESKALPFNENEYQDIAEYTDQTVKNIATKKQITQVNLFP